MGAASVVHCVQQCCLCLSMKEGWLSRVGGFRVRLFVVGFERGSSLYRVLFWMTGLWESAPVAQLKVGRHAARGKAAPAGAKGCDLVSMCQIASLSFLAMSTWATLAPRWRPRRVLVRW